jgi:hypothetical protein
VKLKRTSPSVVQCAATCLLALQVACTGAQDHDDLPSMSVRDSAGIRIVENRIPLIADRPVWEVDPEPDLVLGGSEDNPDALFMRVRSVTSFADGRLAVVDRYGYSISIYDKNGNRTAVIGRQGRGPAEFADDPFVAVVEPDTIVAWDQVSRRLSRFTAEGNLLGEVSLVDALPSHIPLGVGSISWKLRGDGALLSTSTREIRSDGPNRVHMAAPILIHDSSIVELPRTLSSTQVTIQPSARVFASFRYRLVGQPSYGFVGRVVTAVAPEYGSTVVAFGADGNMEHFVRVAVPQLPVTGEMIEHERHRLAMESAPRLRLQPSDVLKAFDEQPLPDSIHPFLEHGHTPEGDTWLLRRPPPGKEPSTVEILDPDGRWLGSFELPRGGESIMELRRDRLITRAVDEWDVPRIHVYRVSGTS